MKKNSLSVAALLLFSAHFSLTGAQIKEPHAASALKTISDSTTRREDTKKIVAEAKPNELMASSDKAVKENAGDASEKISALAGTETDSVVAKTAAAKSPAAAANATLNNALALSSIYRVAAGDTLDIRLLNNSSRASTLYTVLADGKIEYPLAGEPLNVSGLTPEEIAARLASRIKIYDAPHVLVGVRDYASHSIIVTGFVDNPGTKILRREAVPLYVLLTETPPRPDAAQASIVRAGTQIAKVDLTDQTQTAMLIMPGDFIKVVAAPPPASQFYFIGGHIGTPGQKDFRAGLTLTQAILASGGTTDAAGTKTKLSRQGADGRLTTTEYNLKQIEEGKIPDPLLQPGDRLEVGRGHW